MAYTKRTLRRMRPFTRRLALHFNALELQTKAAKRLVLLAIDVEGLAAERQEELDAAAVCSWCGVFIPSGQAHTCKPEDIERIKRFNADLREGVA